MTVSLPKRLIVFLTVACTLLTAVSAYSHNMPMGGSRWCLQKNGLIANIDLNQGLMSDIKEIKEGHYDLAALSDRQLQQVAVDILQPYITRKLSITVNGKAYPVKVDKLVRTNATYSIWLSVDRIGFTRPENSLKIDYRLLFDETNNTHLNMAFLYKSEATGDALQQVFDYSPAEGQHNFENGSPVWDLSVKGAATEADHAPAASATLPAGIPGTRRDRGHAAAQTAVASVSKPDARPEHSVTSDVAVLTRASQPQASTAAAQNGPGPGSTDAGAPLTKDSTQGVQGSTGGEKGKSGSFWTTVGNFILLGIEHILTGYDHIAFLIGLIVIGLSFREVLKIITAFTVAHSITLLLAALQIINLNSRFVESVIALSICYIALENLLRKEVKYRWVITFCFGLIHGFGFASALQELIMGKSNLVLSVLSFNLGVETGQLMIFLVLLPVLHLLKQKVEFRRVTAGVSVAILVFGFTWLVERLFDLKLLPI